MTGHEQRLINMVARAINDVQLFSRFNDMSPEVTTYPIEICRYGKGDEPEIVVLKRHAREVDESQALREAVREQQAIAAISAYRNYDERR